MCPMNKPHMQVGGVQVKLHTFHNQKLIAKELGVVILYVKGSLEKFRHTWKWYNKRTVFITRQALSVKRTRSHKELQDMKQCIYSIPYEGSKHYIRETDTTWHMDFRTYEQHKTRRNPG